MSPKSIDSADHDWHVVFGPHQDRRPALRTWSNFQMTRRTTLSRIQLSVCAGWILWISSLASAQVPWRLDPSTKPLGSSPLYRLPPTEHERMARQTPPPHDEAAAEDAAAKPDEEKPKGTSSDRSAATDPAKKSDQVISLPLPPPQIDPRATRVPYTSDAFITDPNYDLITYDPRIEQSIYGGKYLNATQRPWLEWGRGLYRSGEIPPSPTWLGPHNLMSTHFLLFGDYRMGAAYVDQGGTDAGVWAHRLNLDLDLKLTDTERVHAFIGPLDRNTQFTRVEFNRGRARFFDEFDGDFDTIYFEGDLGSLAGGFRGQDTPFDLPIALGIIPLFLQNGVWMEDNFLGAAATILARNSPRLDWPNFDVTFFAGFDEINSPAFGADDSAARLYGATTFVDTLDGYLELGYVFLDDRQAAGLGYHNVGCSFTRRLEDIASCSWRYIANFGQAPVAGPQTADGHLILWETTFITSQPLTFIPYINLFAGFDRPQSVARAGVAGGVLNNTGILFETDGLTGFPLLDDSANSTYGGAAGINLLGPTFNYQWILELATVQTFGSDQTRRAAGDQYGIGARFQKPIHHAWLIRFDAMYGFLDGGPDVTGIRSELRYKF